MYRPRIEVTLGNKRIFSLQNVLGIAGEIPSAEPIRQRMDDIGDSLRSDLPDANADMFAAHSVFPGTLLGGEVPVDMNAAHFDHSRTMKEGRSRTLY